MYNDDIVLIISCYIILIKLKFEQLYIPCSTSQSCVAARLLPWQGMYVSWIVSDLLCRLVCDAGGVGAYLAVEDSGEFLEGDLGGYCFYTLCPTLHPGVVIHPVPLMELVSKGQHYGVMGLITDWLKDYGAGYKQASRPGFLLGVAQADI